jgi:hypothetical protein
MLAFIFDIDGTLVDSNQLHVSSWDRLATLSPRSRYRQRYARSLSRVTRVEAFTRRVVIMAGFGFESRRLIFFLQITFPAANATTLCWSTKDYGALRGNEHVTFPVLRAARTAAILRA